MNIAYRLDVDMHKKANRSFLRSCLRRLSEGLKVLQQNLEGSH